MLAVKEASHATSKKREEKGTGQTVRLNRLWETLPEPTRHQTLRTLTHIVTRIALPPCRKEVTHESR